MSKDVKKYYGADKKKKIANLIIASLLLISVAIVLVSIFGQNVGNFIISVDTEVQVSLSLSEENNFSKPTARLAAKGIKNQTHATYSDVPKNIMNLEGSNNDEENKRYIAYSFYVKNSSSVSFDYQTEIVINEATRGADSAIRVMVIKDEEQAIYAKAKEAPDEDIGAPEDHIGTAIEENYETIPFASATTVMQKEERYFPKGGVHKYTVVIWIEGWDAQCTDEIKGAIIKMEMKFSAARSS